MTTRPNTCTSVASFLDLVAQAQEWRQPGANWYLQPWFRGLPDADWGLIPSLHRIPKSTGPGADYYTERNLLELFRLRAPPFLDRIPENEWEWLFVMQHYGLPTRLLDWTESALIALYFAVRGDDRSRDAAVWVTNPWWINKCALGDYTLFAADSEKADPWKISASASLPAAPLAIRPIRSTVRIHAQRGVFTVHGSAVDGLDRLFDPCDPEVQLRKLVIPARALADVRRDLAIAGIAESLIFPELEGMCRELRRFFFDA